MKLLSKLLFLILMSASITFLSSCNQDEANTLIENTPEPPETENQLCEAWNLSVGDTCTSHTITGIITEDCQCQVPTSICEGPNNLIGYGCHYQYIDADGNAQLGFGKLDQNCECEPFDCPELEADFGGYCHIDGVSGTVNSDCECEI